MLPQSRSLRVLTWLCLALAAAETSRCSSLLQTGADREPGPGARESLEAYSEKDHGKTRGPARAIEWPRSEAIENVDGSSWLGTDEGRDVPSTSKWKTTETAQTWRAVALGSVFIFCVLAMLWLQSSRASDNPDDNLPVPISQPLMFNLCMLVAYMALGMLVLVLLEATDLSTAWYIVLQVVTTVGYGDVVLDTPGFKLFMAAYVLLGTVLIANVVHECVGVIISSGDAVLRRRLRKLEVSLMDGVSNEDEARTKFKHYNQLIAGTAMYISLILVWVLFFQLVEGCSCSYGRSRAEGCTESNCGETGYTLTVGDSFYMAVITFSTVGFGDFAPKSQSGRIVGGALMVLGVLAQFNLTLRVTSLIHHWKSPHYFRAGKEHFKRMDKNLDGTVARHEFVAFMLVSSGKVSHETVDQLNRLFDAMDSDKNGELKFDEIDGALLSLQ